MRDIEDACKNIDRAAGEVGMLESDRQTANTLLNAYGNQRESLQIDLLKILSSCEISNLVGDWQDRSSQGKEMLSKLNDEVPPRDGEGLAGIGADAFFRGEYKIWDKNAGAGIALAALKLEIIRQAGLKHIADCVAELEEITEKDPVIQEAVRGIFPSIATSLTDAAVNLGKLAWTARGSGMMLWAKMFTDEAGNLIITNIKGTLDLARKRTALKQGLIQHLTAIVETKDRLNAQAIDETYNQGVEGLSDLLDGATGDGYEAVDWREFTNNCKNILSEQRDRAKEVSAQVFDTLAPAFQRRVEVDFKTLFSDPDDLARWKEQIAQLFEQIGKGIENQNQAIELESEGPYRTAAAAVLADVETMFKAIVQSFASTSKDVEDEMREG